MKTAKINYDANNHCFVATGDYDILQGTVNLECADDLYNYLCSDEFYGRGISLEYAKKYFLAETGQRNRRDYRTNKAIENITISFDYGIFNNFKDNYRYFDEEQMDSLIQTMVSKFSDYHIVNALNNNAMQTMFRMKLLYMMLFMQHPVEIELLSKIEGFEKILFSWMMCGSDESKFTRAFKKGNNIDEITQMRKPIWRTLLLAEPDIDTWNVIRLWNGQIKKDQKKEKHTVTGLTSEELDLILSLGLDRVSLDKFRKIIKNAKGINEKPIFTISSLAEYLRRLDMYQAIESYEAIDLLTDYIKMCNDLGVIPNVTSDSLKREHDVIARNHRVFQAQKEVEWQKAKGECFEKRSAHLQKYEYKNAHLVAITPRTIKDLINEGVQNRNCVGSYVDNYSKGNSNIFFVRKANAIDKSYITVELNRDCTKTRQVYYSCNRPVNNISDLNFIKEWLKHNEQVNKKEKGSK